MRHLLQDPHFPDLVAALAAEQANERAGCCANDNAKRDNPPADDSLTALARLDVAATRLW